MGLGTLLLIFILFAIWVYGHICILRYKKRYYLFIEHILIFFSVMVDAYFVGIGLCYFYDLLNTIKI
jgi:hypothetical protein